jgi:hypothetical protein
LSGIYRVRQVIELALFVPLVPGPLFEWEPEQVVDTPR